jgi:hypothetical protein
MRLVGNAINVVYSGSDVRFLFPGGKYTIQIEGTDIDISAVGRGNVSAVGAGTYDDGTLVTDDGTPLNLGRFALAASWGGASSAGSGSDSGKVTTSSSSDSGKPAGYSDSGKTTGSGRG